jgi:molybdopterin-containing oxidoreductase family iron-sulfur binding subunit
MKEKDDHKNEARRKFIKLGVLAGGAAAVSGLGINALASDDDESGEKVKVLTADGKAVEVDSTTLSHASACGMKKSNQEIREGFPDKKFVMVVDLAKCKNALKCQDACNKHHYITGQNAWLKVYKMQEDEDTAPYWMPTMCQHCDEPACVTVCPVDATFKRKDGLVLIDNERCIGCRFCMAACPYGTRVFNWSEPDQEWLMNADENHVATHSPEHAGNPSQKSTVDKCDFCPHAVEQGDLPHCVSACPNDVFLFGDMYEDTVTNGSKQSFKLSKLLKDKSGYRMMEGLGTKPSVFYLPPVNRTDAFIDGLKDFNEFQSVKKPE